jgi:hypothetical protein
MSEVILHLLLLPAFATLWWFARVTGSLVSVAGVVFLALLTVAAFLVFIGFGVVGFPGLT